MILNKYKGEQLMKTNKNDIERALDMITQITLTLNTLNQYYDLLRN